jgi:hypothetical protein
MRGVIVFKLQFINALSLETLREETFKDQNAVQSMIKSLERNRDLYGQDLFLVDNRKRLLSGKFVSYTVGDEVGDIVYRLLFDIQLAKFQPLKSR